MKQQPDSTRVKGNLGNDRDCEWAVILAGGDGTRLKCLTRKIAGDEAQNNSVPFWETELYWRRHSSEPPLSCRASAPCTWSTAPTNNSIHRSWLANRRKTSSFNQVIAAQRRPFFTAFCVSLQSIPKLSWHSFRPTITFLITTDSWPTFELHWIPHARRPDLVILLGLDPESPEVEYGWIEPSAPIVGHSLVFGVRRFWEKPNQSLAQVLQLRGCLWNSFVMVASVQALLEMIESTIPELYRSFAYLSPLFGSRGETRAISKLYERIDEVNFSHQVLALRTERLAVVKVAGVRWNDLGEPKGSWPR